MLVGALVDDEVTEFGDSTNRGSSAPPEKADGRGLADLDSFGLAISAFSSPDGSCDGEDEEKCSFAG